MFTAWKLLVRIQCGPPPQVAADGALAPTCSYEQRDPQQCGSSTQKCGSVTVHAFLNAEDRDEQEDSDPPAPPALGTRLRLFHRGARTNFATPAATRIRKAKGLEAARTVLGHASAAVTEVYAALDTQLAAKIMAELREISPTLTARARGESEPFAHARSSERSAAAWCCDARWGRCSIAPSPRPPRRRTSEAIAPSCDVSVQPKPCAGGRRSTHSGPT